VHLFSGLALARTSTVNHHLVEVPIRNQSPRRSVEFSTFPQPRLKKEKEAKRKKPLRRTLLFFFFLFNPLSNTYKKCCPCGCKVKGTRLYIN
jgi:hypothetical protein